MRRRQDWSPRDRILPEGRKPTPGGGPQQPDWELVANLGDASPYVYGGYFVYRDKTGVYTDDAELLVPEENEEGDIVGYTIFRMPLDQLKMVHGHLVDVNYELSWPHPTSAYAVWFQKDIPSVAETVGYTAQEMIKSFTSEDPIKRAQVYQLMAEYHGWENFDSYPLTNVPLADVKKRYKDDLADLARRQGRR